MKRKNGTMMKYWTREPSEIITATEPLKALLKEEMKKEGYDIGEVAEAMISKASSQVVRTIPPKPRAAV